jgi:hypothetical protein
MMKGKIMAYTFDAQIVSDLHKEAHGCRPSSFWWQCWNESGDEERQREWDDLLDTADRRAAREHQEELKDVAEFERELSEIMNTGRVNKAEALRYMTPIHFEENPDLTSQDIEFWVWERGVLFTDIGRWAVQELKKDLVK